MSLQHQSSESDPGHLSERVRQALSSMFDLSPDEIVVPNNDAKYARRTERQDEESNLSKIFEIMRALNQEGLANIDLGRMCHTGASFREAFTSIIEDTAEVLTTCDYVELGPEPTKTARILETLISCGVEIASYTAVDLNPTSRAVMVDVLSHILPADRIRFVHADYHTLTRVELSTARRPIVMSMLGFQEGNEAPLRMAALYRQILGRGDFLLSEIQVQTPLDQSKIFAFYQNALMQQFSQIVAGKFCGVRRTEYGISLIPVIDEVVGQIGVAVTVERLVERTGNDPVAVITNFCLKPTLEQARRIRRGGSLFDIIAERLTGDCSILFQLARRR